MANQLARFFLLAVIGFWIEGSPVLAATPSVISGLDVISGSQTKIELDHSLKGTVVLFLSARCPCSHSHLGEIQKLVKSYGREFQFVGIHSNANESSKEDASYFQKQELNFPVIRDEKSHFADLFDAAQTPHAFLLSKQGQILYQGGVDNSRNVNRADEHYLSDALNDVAHGREVRLKQGRVLGCIISRP